MSLERKNTDFGLKSAPAEMDEEAAIHLEEADPVKNASCLETTCLGGQILEVESMPSLCFDIPEDIEPDARASSSPKKKKAQVAEPDARASSSPKKKKAQVAL